MRHHRPGPRARRRFLQAFGALAIVRWLPASAAQAELPDIPVMKAFLAGRAPRWERLHLTLPRLADNGFAVPLKVVVDGPFTQDQRVRAIRLFSETNPVPEMASFELPMLVSRVEIDSRIRLAGTQTIVAFAEMSDGTVLADAAEVVVTLAGCMDGT